jgi:Fe-S-cluster containining protein
VDDLYFTFLDGSLGYDCIRCGARCCHGLGFGVGRSELVQLLRKRPVLAPFVQPAGAHAVALDLTEEGCWFLAPDGRCGIEVEEGRAAKPSVCKLFPFNRVYRIGAVTAVEPHLLMCPIEDARGRGVKWAEIAGDLAAAGAEAPLMSAAAPSGLPDDWAERERAVQGEVARLLDARDPIELAAAQGGARDRLEALRAAWRRSLAVDGAEAARWEGEIARPLALLTPSFRFATLFSVNAGPYPKVAGRLPALLLAASLTAGLAARALGRAPALRSIGELYRATAYVREVLVRWQLPASIAGGARGSDLPSPAGEALERLLGRLQEGAPSVGGAFDEAAGELEPPLRHLVLRALADRFGALRF